MVHGRTKALYFHSSTHRNETQTPCKSPRPRNTNQTLRSKEQQLDRTRNEESNTCGYREPRAPNADTHTPTTQLVLNLLLGSDLGRVTALPLSLTSQSGCWISG